MGKVIVNDFLSFPVVPMTCHEITKLMVNVIMTRERSEITKWEKNADFRLVHRKELDCPKIKNIQRLKCRENDKKKRLYDEIYRNQTGRKVKHSKPDVVMFIFRLSWKSQRMVWKRIEFWRYTFWQKWDYRRTLILFQPSPSVNPCVLKEFLPVGQETWNCTSETVGTKLPLLLEGFVTCFGNLSCALKCPSCRLAIKSITHSPRLV